MSGMRSDTAITARSDDMRAGSAKEFTKALPCFVSTAATSWSLWSKSNTPSACAAHSPRTMAPNNSSLSLK